MRFKPEKNQHASTVVPSGVMLEIEVGIRKQTWQRARRYPAYLWSLRWVYAVKKTRRLVYAVYPPPPIHHWLYILSWDKRFSSIFQEKPFNKLVHHGDLAWKLESVFWRWDDWWWSVISALPCKFLTEFFLSTNLVLSIKCTDYKAGTVLHYCKGTLDSVNLQ